jgi:hypothetical protein
LSYRDATSRLIEEIFNDISKLMKRSVSGWDNSGLSTVILRYFEQKFPASKTNLKLCESMILNFLYSVDVYKSECQHCLLFGQLCAELYTPAVPLFIGDLRTIIEDECGFRILSHIEKKGGVDFVKIPYTKIKNIIGRFVQNRGVDNGVEAFSAQLREKFPTVNISLTLASY